MGAFHAPSPVRKKYPVGTALIASCLLCALATAGPRGRSSLRARVPQIHSGPPVLAFNGKDLTGFYTYLHEHKYEDPAKVFTVRDGMLQISGEEFGGLTTCDEFRDYHLVTEWKWGERTWAPRKAKARDSGILLHCVGPDGAAGGIGWSLRSARSSKGAAAIYSWSPGGKSQA